MVPWHGGYCCTWGTKIVDTLAASYLVANISAASDGACQAALTRKTAIYATIATTHILTPIAVETLGPLNSEVGDFLSELDRRRSAIYDEPREVSLSYEIVGADTTL
jgi:hypothetical protein